MFEFRRDGPDSPNVAVTLPVRRFVIHIKLCNIQHMFVLLYIRFRRTTLGLKLASLY